MRSILRLLVLGVSFSLLLDPVPSLASVRHVPSQYSTIQAALDASQAGDTVLVAPGRYTGPGNRNLDFKGIDLVLLAEDGPKSTIIDCNHLGRGFYFHSQEGRGAVVDGFTITHGIGIYAVLGGGGILIDGSFCTIRNCQILSNEGRQSGGGIFIQNSPGVPQQPTVENCLISGNTAGPDAEHPQGEGGGGGIAINGAGPDIHDCVITGNHADPHGGGLWFYGDFLILTECTFSGNSASNNQWGGYGGALYLYAGSPVLAERCIFWGDCAQYYTEICAEGGQGYSYLLCCAIDPSGVSQHVVYQGDQVFTDPRFCNPDACGNAPSINGTYTLSVDSPCLPEHSPCGEVIGALGEGCDLASSVADNRVDAGNVQIWPNPSRGDVHVFIPPSSGGLVRLLAVDATGRVVRHILSAAHSAGNPLVIWDGRDDLGRELPTGVYFTRIETAKGTTTGRVVLAR